MQYQNCSQEALIYARGIDQFDLSYELTKSGMALLGQISIPFATQLSATSERNTFSVKIDSARYL